MAVVVVVRLEVYNGFHHARVGHETSWGIAVDERFRFGENWSKFASRLNLTQVTAAEKSLQQLLDRESLNGMTFLDIGSGSGIVSLVASGMGASVTSFDYDPDSVQTTDSIRDQAYRSDWRVLHGSILDREFLNTLGSFDIVYAWGVLHHTGAMWTALDNAASLVGPGGTLVVALYRKTPLCRAWKQEKKLYASAPFPIQAGIRAVYKAGFVLGLLAAGRNPVTYIRKYFNNRGMDWHTDVHDWLGGYPYESTSASDVRANLSRLGFAIVRSSERRPGFGLFGTGCDEFVATRAH